jgi:hypothetical protein
MNRFLPPIQVTSPSAGNVDRMIVTETAPLVPARPAGHTDMPPAFEIGDAGSVDLHLVPGPSPGGKPDQSRVTMDGAAPGIYHEVDVNTGGAGVATGERLRQPVRQRGAMADRTFQI